MKENIIKAKENSELLKYLIQLGYAKNKAKSLLKYENVWLNGKIVTQFNEKVKAGDTIKITNQRKVTPPFKILYEDEEFLVVHKKEKLLTVATKNNDSSLYQLAKNYLKKKETHEKLFVLHRLDKETSGIVVFCKRQDLTKKLQENWNQLVKKRIYSAVIEGNLQDKAGTLVFFIEEQGEKPVVISNSKNGKKAITHYRVLKTNKMYSLLEVQIDTGRKNQIRASFSHIGHPIVGDKKYYAKDNPIGRVALAATDLEFVHPESKKLYKFSDTAPKIFVKLLK